MSSSHEREWADALHDGEKDETKKRRLSQAVAALVEKAARVAAKKKWRPFVRIHSLSLEPPAPARMLPRGCERCAHRGSDLSELGRRIGGRIRKLRTAPERNWTQEQLAERANLSVSFLSMVERGERVPHVHTLADLSAALGIRLRELFDGVDAPDSGSLTAPDKKRSRYDATLD